MQKLQGSNLRLTEKLIIAFKWIDKKVRNDNIVLTAPSDIMNNLKGDLNSGSD
jgi:hypothetical protein